MSEKKLQIRNSTAEFLVFTKQAGEGGLEVHIEDGTVWLTKKLMATLFDLDVRTISTPSSPSDSASIPLGQFNSANRPPAF